MSTVQTIMEKSGTPVVDAGRPWPGLFAFSEKQSGYFFGRDKETDELFRLVKRDTITVLYSKSGLGKSSLLQAGLFPRMRPAGFLPVYVRLKYDELADPLESQIKSALRDAIEAGDFAEAAAPDTNESLWEYLHHRGGNLIDHSGEVVTPVLVLDQFEEIFTLGVSSPQAKLLRERFLVCFADLAENTKPQALSQRFAEDPQLAAQFDFNGVGCKFVIALREEFVTDLDELRKIPSLSSRSCRMRLKELSGLQALDVVSKPNPELVEPDVAEVIVRFVARNTEGRPLEELEVAPAILSLFCRELSIKRGNEPRITVDLVKGNADTIIDDFYRRYVDDKAVAVHRLIEDELVVSGYRNNIDLSDAKLKLQQDGVSGSVVDELINDRVLHVEDFRGRPRLELTHDVLLEPVIRRREQRRQKEVLEEEKRQRAEAERRADAEARAATSLRFLARGLAIALLVVIAVGAIAIYLWQKAKTAEIQRDSAERRAKGELARELVQAATAAAQRSEYKLAVLLASHAMTNAVTPDSPELATDADASLRAALTAVDGVALLGFDGIVEDVSWAPDGNRLAVVDGKTLQIRDVQSGKVLFKEEKYAGKDVAWSPDGKWLVAAEADGITLRDGGTGRVLQTSKGGRGPIAWHPTLPRFATTSTDHHLLIWQAPDLKKIVGWDVADDAVDGISWSPDGTHIATSSEDFMLRVWDVSNKRRVLNVKAYAPVSPLNSGDNSSATYPLVSWSHEGRRLLATGFLRPLEIRDANTGKVIHTLPIAIAAQNLPNLVATQVKFRDRIVSAGLTSFSAQVPAISMTMAAWSHNGKWLALDSLLQQSLKVFDGDGNHVYMEVPTPDSLATIRWADDDGRVAVVALDKQVRVYKTDALNAQTRDELLKLAREKVKDNLTGEECKQYLHAASCPPRP